MKPFKKTQAVLLALVFGIQLSAFAEGSLLENVGSEPLVPSSQDADQLITAQSNAESLVASKNEILILEASNPVARAAASGPVYFYDSDGKLLSESTFNDQGLLVEEICYDLSGQVIIRITNAYDANARVISQKRYSWFGALLSETNFIYNTQGELTQTEDIHYDGLGQVALRTTSHFDSSRKLTDQQTVNGQDALLQDTVFGYASSGRLAGRQDTFFSAAGQQTNKFLFTYDANERLTSWNETHYTQNVTTGQLNRQWMDWYVVSSGGVAYRSRRIEYDINGDAVNIMVFDIAGNLTSTFDSSLIGDVEGVPLWFSQNQEANASGLITSHPDDPGFIFHNGVQQEWAKIYANTQAYTYDQALAGITMLDQAAFDGAKRIFDFYYAEWQAEQTNFTGFWTVYNVDPAFAWKRYEWRKGMGENAWIALFCLRYSSTMTDPTEKAKALALATEIARWISTLPHKDGAVAMSPDNPTGNPNYGNIYSVENNLDYYAILKALSTQASAPADRALFTSELNNLKNWLSAQAYDAATGLFRRGGSVNLTTGQMVWDPIKSLDVNSWAISALGLATLQNDFGIDIDAFAAQIGNTFAVQEDGSFGGNLFTAKGFDFSDASNAGAIGRPGIKWVEGTNQMILAYELLADFYSTTDQVKSFYYQSLADYFLSRNPENAIPVVVTPDLTVLSYSYADQANVQIYYGAGNWRTFPGQAAPSVGWVYFALRNLNPFDFI